MKTIIISLMIVLCTTSCMAQKTTGTINLRNMKNAAVELKNTGDAVAHGTVYIAKKQEGIKKTFGNVRNVAELANAVTVSANDIQRITGTVTSVGGTVNNNYGNGQGGNAINEKLSGVNSTAQKVSEAGKNAAGINGAIKGISEWSKIFK